MTCSPFRIGNERSMSFSLVSQLLMGFAVDTSTHHLNLKIHHVVNSPVGPALVGFFTLEWNRQHQTTLGEGNSIVGDNLREGVVAAGKSNYMHATRNPDLGIP